MYDPSSFANPTPLAQADTLREVLPRRGPQPGVMLSDIISFDSRTTLVIIRGTLSPTVCRCHSENCFAAVPFVVPGLIFQQNNARSHMAGVAMNCLTVCQAHPWPARSSDLFSIEHDWDMMGR
ncbi:transposable element Tc1 transposase [Trichonephila clavipes]|nr:transposable element Tc1 transposase [Trichonephila clavipes]